MIATRRALLIGVVTVEALSLSSCKLESKRKPAPRTAVAQVISVEPRVQLLATFPCSGCHADLEPRPKRYVLSEFHVVRNDEFSHGEDAFWCYQCHSLNNIDRLVTATGEEVTFNDAWRICTSCHGDKLKDWRTGVHGLVTGDWNGAKHKKSCPACHDPHDPRYPSIEPEKPPEAIRAMKL